MTGMPKRHHDTPSRRPLYVRGALLVALCAVLSILPGAAPREPAADDVPGQVLTELRHANAARAQHLAEQQDWAMEAQRLQLLLATVNDEASRLTAEADDALKEQAALRKHVAGLRDRQERLEQIEAIVDTLCEQLERALDDLAARSLPGLVPPDQAAQITEPGKRLAAAAARLETTERRAAKAAVEIVQGSLGGKIITIKLLRLGGVAAWWIALDGRQTGSATMVGRTLTLRLAAAPQDAEEIRKALAIVEGRAAANWTLLPMADTSSGKDGGARP